jgi:hypothetical protein
LLQKSWSGKILTMVIFQLPGLNVVLMMMPATHTVEKRESSSAGRFGFETIRTDSWRIIYQTAAVCSLLIALFIPLQLFVYFTWPPPATVTGWFQLFDESPMIGLLDMDLLLIVDTVLFIPVFLALYQVLFPYLHGPISLALILALIGIASYCASAEAFQMLSLSKQYMAAGSEGERAIVLSSGQSSMTNWMGSSFLIGYVLQSLSILIMSLVMLKAREFGKAISWLGIIIGIMMLLPPNVGKVGLYLSVSSVFPLWFWCLLLSRKFYLLGRQPVVKFRGS